MTQPTFAELLQCELCYVTDADVKIGLAWYRDVELGQAIQSIARCLDGDACRSRVEARGERWPLRIPGSEVAA